MNSHPLSREWFVESTPTVAEFVGQILAQVAAGKRHILVKAPVKSGKKVITEFIAMSFSDRRTKYITSLNRKDVKTQKAELEKYGISCFCTSGADIVSAAIADVRFDIKGKRQVVCCFDECDYGSASRQLLASLYEAVLDELRVVNIYFSATSHETAASNLTTRADFVALTYTPPSEYCGARYFLDNELVFDPLPFFDDEDGCIRVTKHGICVIRDSITPDRHIAVVRVTRAFPTARFKDEDVKAAIAAQLMTEVPGGKPWDIHAIDNASPFNWEDRITMRGYTGDDEVNHLFVIHQTCTRGTDLKGWHHKLAFWHDQRGSEAVSLNTMIQAALRPCHYSSNYGGVPQRVRLYVDRRIVKMAADDNMEEYLAASGKAPARTKAENPRGQAPGWAKPIRVHIPQRLRTPSNVEEYFEGNLTDDRRDWWMARLRTLLSEEEYRLLEGRTLKGKRANGTGIATVHKAYTEGRGSRPGGGNVGMDEIRQRHFWLDIATEDLTGVRAGTAYITYGIKEEKASGHRGLKTTPASMFESRKGDI
jgi:hypothetical protein